MTRNLNEPRRIHSRALSHLAVEIDLKVYICRTRNQSGLQKAYQLHDPAELLHAAGLFEIATEGKRNPRDTGGSVTYSHGGMKIVTPKENWKTVLQDHQKKIIDLRYENPSTTTQALAKAFFEAVSLAPNGVIPWLWAQEEPGDDRQWI